MTITETKKLEVYNANPEKTYGCVDLGVPLTGLKNIPFQERKLFGIDSKGHEIRVGSVLKFYIGKRADTGEPIEKIASVSFHPISAYKATDGVIIFPEKEEWRVGGYTLTELIKQRSEVVGNI